MEIPLQRFSGKVFWMSTFVASEKIAAKSGLWHVIDAEGQVLGRLADRKSVV